MKLTDAFSLSRLVQQHRMQLARLALLLAVVLPISTAGASLLTSEWRVQRYLLLYHAPLFLAFLLWVRLRLLDLLAWTTPTLLLDSLVVLLAAARFLNGSLPLSGHMLFFVFFRPNHSQPVLPDAGACACG
jgi:hypothetical protein